VRFVSVAGRCAAAFVATLAVADVLVRLYFPALDRFAPNFSAAYLNRTIAHIGTDQRLVVLGDSVLWGYRLPARESAASIIDAGGVPTVNLAFEGGSLPNTYAMLRLMQRAGVRPRAVLFNVNLKQFNPADSAYDTLYPAVETGAWPALSTPEQRLLRRTQSDSFEGRASAWLSRTWALYALRNDLREAVFGAADAATAVERGVNRLSGEAARGERLHVPAPDRFLGTYDLSALTDANVEVAYLRGTASLLRRQRIPAVALLTPVNHRLLHRFIDVPEYERQRRYVRAILEHNGVRVVDYDRAFAAADFLDNDHLTAQGNRKLAAMLKRTVLRDL
jgi:hypothetical protein